MSDRESFSDEEWTTLIGAPVAVISAVIGASIGNPVAIMREVAAAVKFFERSAEQRRDNPLIVALLLSLKSRFDAFNASGDPAVEQLDIMELGREPARAVAACREARELLERKADPELAAELRAWLIELGSEVALAAPEGGFLGIGGERVNAAERTILAELAAALDVAPPTI
jgi:hypothetical protein